MSPPILTFSNPGEIDPRLISTFGANVKEGDNPIGFFGTGLKYALAILLRTGHKVTIWSGLKEYTFGTEESVIRGKSFTFITMNGTPLGFTTEVGKSWQPWMAYRELLCNARDEGGDVSLGHGSRATGKTLVVVEGAGIVEVHNNASKYFLQTKPIAEAKCCDIHFGSTPHLFYRGVRVYTHHKPFAYTYNLRTKMELTEDRTLSGYYPAMIEQVRAIAACRDEVILRRTLTAPSDFAEADFDWNWMGVEYGDAFLNTVEEIARRDLLGVPMSARQVLERARPKRLAPEEVELDRFEQAMLDRAKAFCHSAGFPIAEYPVIPVESLGKAILGLAADGKIFITRSGLHLGVKQLACTLIEEFLHLRHGVQDCSRPMQELLLNHLITAHERLRGEPL